MPTYIAESVPNGNGNDTFDKYLTNGRLEKQVAENSNILKFFKQSSRKIFGIMRPFDTQKIPPASIHRDTVYMLPSHVSEAKVRINDDPENMVEHIKRHKLITITKDGRGVVSDYKPYR